MLKTGEGGGKMSALKLLAVFAVLIIVQKLAKKLYWAILASIVATVLLWLIPVKDCGIILWISVKDWDNIQVVLILYCITTLQRMLERRNQLKAAQQDLNGIFNNRRVNATLAPIFIGLLPSAAAVRICGEIVDDASGDRLDINEKSFVSSFYRHIPESCLPTYSSIIIMSQLSGVAVSSFLLGMLPMIAVLYILGYVFYIRRIPGATGQDPSHQKLKDTLHLFGHLWTLLAIILIILIFKVNTLLTIAAVTLAAFFVYRFKLKELPGLLKEGFEPVLIVNTILILVFKGYILHTGVIDTLPELFSRLPVPTWLIFALIFFFGTLAASSTSIIAACTVVAFSSIPGAGMPLMVLLNCFSYADMQITPTHVCLTVITDYFHTNLMGLIKKTLPVIACFCAAVAGYYLLLTGVFGL